MTTINLTETERRRAMRQAVLCQCFGVLGQALFASNVVLLYLLALGITETQTLIFLALPGILMAGLVLPVAHIATRLGLKRTGDFGVLVNVVGVVILGTAGTFNTSIAREIISGAGIIVYGIGMALFTSVWFPLLRPIVAESVRGRFFGTLRVSWQIVSLLASALMAFLLSLSQDLAVFQIILIVASGLILVRSVFYRGIPEIVEFPNERAGLLATLVKLGGYREYVAFGSYVFLLTIFTFVCPSLFALVERTALHLTQATVVMLSNAGMAGAIIGFWAGGIAVDRFGTKYVFLSCHFSFGLVLILFILRGLFPPGALLPVLYLLHFLFGAVFSASTIAITSESMALSPGRHLTLALALLNTVMGIGHSLSGFLSAGMLKAGFLMKSWTWFGMALCDVDAVIFAYGVMIVMLVVTLGLVPSIFTKTDENAMM